MAIYQNSDGSFSDRPLDKNSKLIGSASRVGEKVAEPQVRSNLGVNDLRTKDLAARARSRRDVERAVAEDAAVQAAPSTPFDDYYAGKAPGSAVDIPADVYVQRMKEFENSRPKMAWEDPNRPRPAAANSGLRGLPAIPADSPYADPVGPPNLRRSPSFQTAGQNYANAAERVRGAEDYPAYVPDDMRETPPKPYIERTQPRIVNPPITVVGSSSAASAQRPSRADVLRRMDGSDKPFDQRTLLEKGVGFLEDRATAGIRHADKNYNFGDPVQMGVQLMSDATGFVADRFGRLHRNESMPMGVRAVGKLTAEGAGKASEFLGQEGPVQKGLETVEDYIDDVSSSYVAGKEIPTPPAVADILKPVTGGTGGGGTPETTTTSTLYRSKDGTQVSDKPFPGAEPFTLGQTAASASGGTLYTNADGTEISDTPFEGSQPLTPSGRTRNVLRGVQDVPGAPTYDNTDPYGVLRRGGLGTQQNVGVSGSDASLRVPVNNQATNDITQRYGYSERSASDRYRPVPYNRRQTRQISGAAEGGNILRELNKINDRADRAYEKARHRGLSPRFAAMEADALRARGDQLIGYDRNMATREGDQLSADVWRERTAADIMQTQAALMAGLSKEQQAAIKDDVERLALGLVDPESENPEVEAAWMSTLITANLPRNIDTFNPRQRNEALQQAAADARLVAAVNKLNPNFSFLSRPEMLQGLDSLQSRPYSFLSGILRDGPLDAVISEIMGHKEARIPGTDEYFTVQRLQELREQSRRGKRDLLRGSE